MTPVALLPDRCVLDISGADRVAFLQGLVSNDVTLAQPGRAVWAGFLTPQGRYRADVFILAEADRLFLDVAQSQAEMLLHTLRRFRLRQDVTIRPAGRAVHVAWHSAPVESVNAIIAPDPRCPAAGWRILGPVETVNADAAAWDTYRLSLGLPEGARDLEPGQSLLLEAGFDELHGVSWSKGCYMGQELTARTKYRGLLKRRLMPVRIKGPPPPFGAPVLADERDVGTMRSSRDDRGMAMMRLDALDLEHKAEFLSGQAVLIPWRPAWMDVASSST